MSEEVYTNCTVGGPVYVHVEDGKITKVRPLVYDEEETKQWKIKADSREFSPRRKAALAPYVFTEKTRVYSEDRLKYPMKRVDFDPEGKRNPENRGESGYERISWDEALDIVSNEIKRIRNEHGPSAVTAITSSHHNWGNIGYKMSAFQRFFNLLGYTKIFDNPDSWEGWHWGSVHNWGFYWRLGVPEQYDMLEDGLKNSDLLIYWSNDPESTMGGYGGQESSIWRRWLKELGREQIFIDPFYNYSAAFVGDKWIAPKPGTDASVAEAIAYTWINEDDYDKDYINTHANGFESFKEMILGESDGVPKTPERAEEISGVESHVIKALARKWASNRTMLCAGNRGGMGGACREAYGHEWARLMVLLQAMQGLGKPGVGIWGTSMGAPYNADFEFPGYADGGITGSSEITSKMVENPAENPVEQKLYRPLFPDAILDPPIEWKGEGFCGESIDQQFKQYKYPMEGASEVKMFYRYGGSFIGTMLDTNKWVEAYKSPKLEFVVNQNVFMDPETKFTDIILPACTNFERNDIGEWSNISGYSRHSATTNLRVIVYQQKCIDPLYESKSDYQIFTELADRLGFKEEYTEGNTAEDWIRKMFEVSDLPEFISFEEFKEKGYFIVPIPEDYESTPALRWFYEDRPVDTPDNNPKERELGTRTGEIEFVSQSLKEEFPDDEERPPLPRYIESWEGVGSEKMDEFPLQLISPHPRYSYHTHYDTHTPWLGEIPGHRIYKNGYYWRPVRIHPEDARERGIKNMDIVKVHNDRGGVLCIARVTERIRPGVVHCYTSSSKYDPLEPGKPGSIDRGGCINLLTPSRLLSKNAPGMAPNSCLVEISRWEG